MIAAMFMWAGVAMIIAPFAAYLNGRIKIHVMRGMWAISWGLTMIAQVINHDHVWAIVDAAGTAWFAWLWWNGGGGDDTKRRLKKIAKKFQPVRRTAPQGA